MGELATEVLGEWWDGTSLALILALSLPLCGLRYVSHFSLGLSLLCKMYTVIPTKKVVKTRGDAYIGAKLVSDTW